MIPEEINNLAWEDAERWLRRHGYGLTQIADIKAELDAATVVAQPEVAAEPVVEKATKPAVKAEK